MVHHFENQVRKAYRGNWQKLITDALRDYTHRPGLAQQVRAEFRASLRTVASSNVTCTAYTLPASHPTIALIGSRGDFPLQLFYAHLGAGAQGAVGSKGGLRLHDCKPLVSVELSLGIQ